ncbi:related to folylpolyglutamate synthase [Ramularia collo-cygni]|uniref:Related to folylpolyglutamate synthase n=1 Tax=Ramularia collo-cygni TaxID=112498 RepID=A0A2D3USY1_9PEZI|nr:related to folylpolyglutamate synthase [Ramularia collo-cygni]CZT16955.1 related to folylpolyglutamate synthase [Ramularia collo-cygni]
MLQAYNRSDYRVRRGQEPLRHGRFTSPHLVDRWDCISITSSDAGGLKPVTSELFHEVEKSVLTRCQEENLKATEFELLTATAFNIFNRSSLDVAVVEVGVGGRLDSTNIIGQPVVDDTGDCKSADITSMECRPPPLVTAIAKIGMDHQGLLGDTLEAIAHEKAGIIKPGVPVVFDTSNDPRVHEVLKAIAAKNASPLVDRGTINIPDMPLHWAVHTRQNMEVAFLATWTALTSLGRVQSPPSSSDEDLNDIQDLQSAMMNTAEHTTFPGRQEWIDICSLTGRKEPVLLDGAHNPQSAQVLADKVHEIRTSLSQSGETQHRCDPVTWVVAMSEGKPLNDFWQPLLKAGDNVFGVEFGPVDGMPWVQPTSSLDVLNSAKAVVPVLGLTQSYGPDIVGALQAACIASEKTPGKNLVIAGSLYLVGAVHRHLRERVS